MARIIAAMTAAPDAVKDQKISAKEPHQDDNSIGMGHPVLQFSQCLMPCIIQSVGGHLPFRTFNYRNFIEFDIYDFYSSEFCPMDFFVQRTFAL